MDRTLKQMPDVVRREINRVLQLGWRIKQGKHIKLVRPGYGMVVISRSPSDYRFEHKVCSDIRRLEAR